MEKRSWIRKYVKSCAAFSNSARPKRLIPHGTRSGYLDCGGLCGEYRAFYSADRHEKYKRTGQWKNMCAVTECTGAHGIYIGRSLSSSLASANVSCPQ
jgi:hypothetical protein